VVRAVHITARLGHAPPSLRQHSAPPPPPAYHHNNHPTKQTSSPRQHGTLPTGPPQRTTSRPRGTTVTHPTPSPISHAQVVSYLPHRRATTPSTVTLYNPHHSPTCPRTRRPPRRPRGGSWTCPRGRDRPGPRAGSARLTWTPLHTELCSSCRPRRGCMFPPSRDSTTPMSSRRWRVSWHSRRRGSKVESAWLSPLGTAAYTSTQLFCLSCMRDALRSRDYDNLNFDAHMTTHPHIRFCFTEPPWNELCSPRTVIRSTSTSLYSLRYFDTSLLSIRVVWGEMYIYTATRRRTECSSKPARLGHTGNHTLDPTPPPSCDNADSTTLPYSFERYLTCAIFVRTRTRFRLSQSRFTISSLRSVEGL